MLRTFHCAPGFGEIGVTDAIRHGSPAVEIGDELAERAAQIRLKFVRLR